MVLIFGLHLCGEGFVLESSSTRVSLLALYPDITSGSIQDAGDETGVDGVQGKFLDFCIISLLSVILSQNREKGENQLKVNKWANSLEKCRLQEIGSSNSIHTQTLNIKFMPTRENSAFLSSPSSLDPLGSHHFPSSGYHSTTSSCVNLAHHMASVLASLDRNDEAWHLFNTNIGKQGNPQETLRLYCGKSTVLRCRQRWCGPSVPEADMMVGIQVERPLVVWNLSWRHITLRKGNSPIQKWKCCPSLIVSAEPPFYRDWPDSCPDHLAASPFLAVHWSWRASHTPFALNSPVSSVGTCLGV